MRSGVKLTTHLPTFRINGVIYPLLQCLHGVYRDNTAFDHGSQFPRMVLMRAITSTNNECFPMSQQTLHSSSSARGSAALSDGACTRVALIPGGGGLNICGFSVWNLLYVTLLAPRILTWLIQFCRNYTDHAVGRVQEITAWFDGVRSTTR